MKVEDLFFDLADGSKLVKLLEIVSGEKLGKNKMRVHRNKNVNKTRAFLRTKVRLENIGAEHIVDGIRRMLGLIWTIILRFRIQVSLRAGGYYFYITLLFRRLKLMIM